MGKGGKIVYFNRDEMKVFEIGGVHFGGQPGEYPTVLIGGIRSRDELDREMAERIRKLADYRKEFAIPCLVDLFVRNEEDAEERISFVADNTDLPFFVDMPTGSLGLKKKVFEFLKRKGLSSRVIYNSVNIASSDEELKMMQENGIKNALLLTFNSANPTVNGALEVASGGGDEPGLIERLEEHGVSNILLDPGVAPMVMEGDLFLTTIVVLKQKTGYPVGCAPCNLPESWTYLKEIKKEDGERWRGIYRSCTDILDAIAIDHGADFIFYGRLSYLDEAKVISTAMFDKITLKENGRFGLEPGCKDHPGVKLP